MQSLPPVNTNQTTFTKDTSSGKEKCRCQNNLSQKLQPVSFQVKLWMENLICGDDLRPPHINIGFLDVYCQRHFCLSDLFLSISIRRGGENDDENFMTLSEAESEMFDIKVSPEAQCYFRYPLHLLFSVGFLIIINILRCSCFLNRPSSALRQLPNKMSIILCTNLTRQKQCKLLFKNIHQKLLSLYFLNIPPRKTS